MVYRAQTLTLISLLGSLAGFAAQVCLAKFFGISVAVDSYFFSVSTPGFVGGLVGGAINFLLTPQLRRIHAAGSSNPTHSVRTLALVLNLLVSCLAVIGVPLQLSSLPAGSSLRVDPALPWMLAGGWLFAGALVHQAVIAAELTAQDRLLTAALLPLGAPVVATVLILAGQHRLGVASMLVGQVLGSWAATAIGVARCTNTKERTGGEVRHLLRLVIGGLPSAAAAMACFAAYPLIDSFLAPRAGDHVMSQISFAQRVIIGLGGLAMAAPLAMATNRFADLAVHGNLKTFISQYRRFLRLTILPVGGLAILLMAGGDIVVEFLFGWGRFGAEEVRVVGRATALMAPGMVLMLLTSLTFRAAFALNGGPHVFALVGVVWAACYALFGALLMRHGAQGLAVAYTASWVLGSVFAWVLLHRGARSHFEGFP